MLVEADDASFAALIAGQAPPGLALPEGDIETAEILVMLRTLAAAIRPRFAPAAWLIVEAGEYVGLCSIMQAPATAGPIDIGYGIAAARRGRGAATRAIADLLAWARADLRVTRVTASTSIHNRPSQRVLERNFFLPIGTRTHPEDGDLICWEILTE